MPGGASSTRDLLLSERMFKAVEALETDPGSRQKILEALEVARTVLTAAGYPTLESVRRTYPREFVHGIKEGYEVASSLALEVIAWHHYCPNPRCRDLGVMFLERAALLSPSDIQIVGRFASKALMLKAGDLRGLADNPKKQRETEVGYKIRAKAALEDLLVERFAITGPMIMGIHGKNLFQHLVQRPEIDVEQVGGLISILSGLSCELGIFFEKEAHAHFAFYAGVAQLETLGYERPYQEQLRLIEDSAAQSPLPRELVDQKEPLVLALENMARGAGLIARLLDHRSFGRLAIRLEDLLSRIDPDPSA